MVDLALTLGQLALALFLVVLNGFFVASEFAFVRIRSTSVEQMAEEGEAGAEVLQDASIPTDQGAGTEDSIIGIRTEDSPVFVENGGTPRTLRFDMLNAEEITLAVWGYSAFASGRYPKSIAEITGTGLTAPTF